MCILTCPFNWPLLLNATSQCSHRNLFGRCFFICFAAASCRCSISTACSIAIGVYKPCGIDVTELWPGAPATRFNTRSIIDEWKTFTPRRQSRWYVEWKTEPSLSTTNPAMSGILKFDVGIARTDRHELSTPKQGGSNSESLFVTGEGCSSLTLDLSVLASTEGCLARFPASVVNEEAALSVDPMISSRIESDAELRTFVFPRSVKERLWPSLSPGCSASKSCGSMLHGRNSLTSPLLYIIVTPAKGNSNSQWDSTYKYFESFEFLYVSPRGPCFRVRTTKRACVRERESKETGARPSLRSDCWIRQSSPHGYIGTACAHPRSPIGSFHPGNQWLVTFSGRQNERKGRSEVGFRRGRSRAMTRSPFVRARGRRNREPLAPFVAAAGTDSFFALGWSERRKGEREREIVRQTDRGWNLSFILPACPPTSTILSILRLCFLIFLYIKL